jgi:hypothetical protein
MMCGVVATLFMVFLRYQLGGFASMIGGLFIWSMEGIWDTKFWKGKETFEESATVHQILHWVWGEIEYCKNNRIKIYNFRGTVYNNVLIATYELKGKASTTVDRGAFTLALAPSSDKMEGTYAWMDADFHIPQGGKYMWKKRDKVVPSHSIVIQQSPIHGKGVFARTKLSAGQKIAYFEGYEIDHDTRYSLGLDGKRIEPTGKLRYLNHSCAQNAHFRGRWLVASRDISHDEEITVDYLATENMIYHHFTCKCGAKNCQKLI